MSEPEGGGRFRAFLASYWTPAGKQALRNLIGLIVCTGISQACALGVLLMLTHGLSQAAFGAVIFALNVQTYLVTLGTFGLATIVVRDLTQQPEKANETTTAFLTIVGVASLLTGILTAVVAALVPITWDERVMLWCVAAGNVFACLNLNPLFDAAHRQALAAALMVPGDLLAVSVIGGLSAAGLLTVPVVGFAILGKLCLTVALQATVFGRVVRPFAWKEKWGRIREMIRAGRSMIPASLLSTIPLNGTVILVAIFSGQEAAAIYGVSFQILNVELLLVVLVMRILQPHVSGPHGLSQSFIWKLVLVLSLLICALTLLFIGGARILFYYILPISYEPGFRVFAIIHVYMVCSAPTIVINMYLLRLSREAWIWGQHVAAVTIYLTLILAGMHKFQLGFAVSTSVSSAVLLTVALIALRCPGGKTEAVSICRVNSE